MKQKFQHIKHKFFNTMKNNWVFAETYIIYCNQSPCYSGRLVFLCKKNNSNF